MTYLQENNHETLSKLSNNNGGQLTPDDINKVNDECIDKIISTFGNHISLFVVVALNPIFRHSKSLPKSIIIHIFLYCIAQIGTYTIIII